MDEFHWMGLALGCLGGFYLVFHLDAENKPEQGKDKVKYWTRSLYFMVRDLKNVPFLNTQLSYPLASSIRRCGLVQATMLVLYLVVFHSLANLPLSNPLAREVSARFSIQPNTIIALWIGMGLTVISRTLQKRGLRKSVGHQTIRIALCLGIIMYQYHYNKPISPVESDDLIRTYGEAILEMLPPNAMLLSYTDINWNTIRYLQVTRHTQSDCTQTKLTAKSFMHRFARTSARMSNT